MSVFGPNQVEELIVSTTTAPTETTLSDFLSTASEGEVKLIGVDGLAAGAGDKFRYYQKAAAAIGGHEFSDVIDPAKVSKVILKTYAAETQKSVDVTVNAAVAADTTYIVEARIYNDGGTLSPENFAIVSGYYVTPSNVAGLTSDDIAAGLADSLNKNLIKRGDNELDVTVAASVITIAGKPQSVVPGKIIGKQIEFEVTGKSFDNTALVDENSGLVSAVTTAENNPGAGTGKYAVNLEWFTKGYKYEVYRQTGYPADFSERTPYYASASKGYNVCHVKYFDDRANPSVEKQEKVLTIITEFAVLADNAAMNAVLTDLAAVLANTGVSVPAATLPVA